MPRHPDVLIHGAGVIGLSLALELRARGFGVTITDRGTPLAQASTAAAGMLAVGDPHNPPELLPLSRLSRSLYPDFLARIEATSGLPVPWQTTTANQILPGGDTLRLAELSIDPRQLAPALLGAAIAAGVQVTTADSTAQAEAGTIVYTTGAWQMPGLPVFPRKGQMLRVKLPSTLELREVYRSERVYVVPRTQGPQAGTALVGATVEDAGFDYSISPEALRTLRQMAAEMVPEMGDETCAPAVEAWAGLRPATPDGLPILGAWQHENTSRAGSPIFVATGHFRNGILLAPGTAAVVADAIEGRSPGIDLQPFSAARFAGNLAA